MAVRSHGQMMDGCRVGQGARSHECSGTVQSTTPHCAHLRSKATIIVGPSVIRRTTTVRHQMDTCSGEVGGWGWLGRRAVLALVQLQLSPKKVALSYHDVRVQRNGMQHAAPPAHLDVEIALAHELTGVQRGHRGSVCRCK